MASVAEMHGIFRQQQSFVVMSFLVCNWLTVCWCAFCRMCRDETAAWPDMLVLLFDRGEGPS